MSQIEGFYQDSQRFSRIFRDFFGTVPQIEKFLVHSHRWKDFYQDSSWDPSDWTILTGILKDPLPYPRNWRIIHGILSRILFGILEMVRILINQLSGCLAFFRYRGRSRIPGTLLLLSSTARIARIPFTMLEILQVASIRRQDRQDAHPDSRHCR